MTALAADRAIEIAKSCPAHDSSGRGVPNINPGTGLSTDYLNHFTEAVMMLEMIAVMPDGLDELKAWRPMTYCEHFAASRFSRRDTEPSICCAAMRAWYSVVASIRSRTASACGRSIRPWRYARNVNSPGSANLAPAAQARSAQNRNTTGDPWQEISIKSSAV